MLIESEFQQRRDDLRVGMSAGGAFCCLLYHRQLPHQLSKSIGFADIYKDWCG